MAWDSAHPLIVASLSGFVVGVLTLLANRFVIKPKYCLTQSEALKAEIAVTSREDCVRFEKELNTVKTDLESHKKLSHEVFVRKDVMGPQMLQITKDITYVRKRLDQIATARRLPLLSDQDDSEF